MRSALPRTTMIIPPPKPPKPPEALDGPLCPSAVRVDDHDIGGSLWVTVRSRFRTFIWITPGEAHRLGQYLIAKYPSDET